MTHDRKKLKADTPFMRQLVHHLYLGGNTQEDIGEKTGISKKTVERWLNNDNRKEDADQPTTVATSLRESDIQEIRSTLNSLDYSALSKLTLMQDMINDEFIAKALKDELSDLEITKLSKLGLDVAKIAGIRWDKVMLRDGTITHLQSRTSPEQMILMLLAKAEADRAKAASIQAEKEAYEVMKEQGVIDL